MTTWVVSLLLIAAGTSFGGNVERQQASTVRQVHVFENTLTRNIHLRYLLYLPEPYAETQKKWPLLLYLHGGKGRGDDFDKMMWYPVVRMCESGKHQIPFVVLAPQCPEGEMWTDTEALVALLDQVISTHRVDAERVYLAGYSMGGNGAWYLAYKHPDRFTAIAPMSGMANVWWSYRLKDLPVWVFHGADDDLVPARESQEMVDALTAKGGEVTFSLVKGRGHRPPTDEEHLTLFEWLLTHRGTAGDLGAGGGVE